MRFPRSRGLLPLAVLVALAAAAAGPAAAQGAATCSDNYDRIIAAARAEWPFSGYYEIPGRWLTYFMAAYNAEAENPVKADRVVVFPMDPSESATWWFFGFADGCLTFYADFGEAKAYHMIEQGYAMFHPEQQLQ